MFYSFAFITYSNTEWEAAVDNVLVGVGFVVVVVVVKDVVLSRSHATRNNIRNKNNF